MRVNIVFSLFLYEYDRVISIPTNTYIYASEPQESKRREANSSPACAWSPEDDSSYRCVVCTERWNPGISHACLRLSRSSTAPWEKRNHPLLSWCMDRRRARYVSSCWCTHSECSCTDCSCLRYAILRLQSYEVRGQCIPLRKSRWVSDVRISCPLSRECSLSRR